MNLLVVKLLVNNSQLRILSRFAGRRWVAGPGSTQELVAGFDQEAATVTMARLVSFKMENEPQGAAVHNHVIHLALSMVASEIMKFYSAISDGTANLVDKFFEMQRHDAVKTLDIYRRAGQQPPASFLQAMEEYVKEAPRGSTFRKEEQVKQIVYEKPTVLAIEDKNVTDVKEEQPPSPPPEPVKEEKPMVEAPDLLSMDDPTPVASDLDEKNALALAIVSVDDLSTTAPPPNLQNGATGWELTLVTAPSSNESATAATNLGGGFDKLTLDSLYDDAMRRNNQATSYNPWEAAPMRSNQIMQTHDPFYASNAMAASHSVQMAAMASQQQAFLMQHQMMMGQHQMMTGQQQMMMGQQQPLPMNPYGNPYAASPYGPSMPVQPYNPNPGFL